MDALPERSMTRLRLIPEDELDADQRKVWDGVTGGRRGSATTLTNPDGSLVGPFNALLYSPRVGERIAALGDALRFDSSIERSLLELAIITVGAHWKSNFEWWAHRRMALEAGVSPEIVDAIGSGGEPVLGDAAQQTVYGFTHSLVTTGRVDDDRYAAAVALLGEAGVVELIALTGYYCLVSMMLNGLRIPLPQGNQPNWPD